MAARDASHRTAWVVLEDGLTLEARAVAAEGTTLGEMVFTTSMSGYQETVTDPSYIGQILTFAAPMIGNYGAGPGYSESERVQTSGVIMARSGDNPGAAGSTGWNTWLTDKDVIAVEGVDTRRLVTHLREKGVMRGGISTELDPEALLERVQAHPVLDGQDLVSTAGRERRTVGTDGPRIAAIDCGIKESIAQRMAAAGCRLEIFTPAATVDEILAVDPAALFCSNGPGDPAAAGHVVATIGALLGKVPVFGICMGHQLLARALGLGTERLPFGHRGANHPVRRVEDDRVEITVQNHGYAVSADRLPDGVQVTRTSLFDGSVEGIRAPDVRAWSVQYHPEARPGPNDAGYAFREFVAEVA